jgi:hypothetical protein
MQRPRVGRIYQGRFWATTSKHIPVARQQILTNAIVGLQQWNNGVYCVVCGEMLYAGQLVKSEFVQESVKRGLELEAQE